MTPVNNRIGLLGGTFDPVHRGHQEIADSYLKKGPIDELWILLTPDPPHKQHQQFCPYDHRKKMLQLAFEEFDDVTISDVELSLPTPSYTVQTLEYLQDSHPEVTFYLCIGEDSLLNFEDWYKWETIIEKCRLLVTARLGFDASNVDSKILKNAKVVNHTPIQVSSTEIRKRIAADTKEGKQLPKKVLSYIKEHRLYS